MAGVFLILGRLACRLPRGALCALGALFPAHVTLFPIPNVWPGFGGDVIQSWESLAYMIYFTQTASNVLFGWWGQEIMQRADPELFTRVIQFGAMSPIYTNWGNNGSDDNLWQLPEEVCQSRGLGNGINLGPAG